MMAKYQDIIDAGFDLRATYEWTPIHGRPDEPVMLKISLADSYWTTRYWDEDRKDEPVLMIYTMLAENGEAFAKGTPYEVHQFTRKLP